MVVRKLTYISNFEYAWNCPRWEKQFCGHLLKMATQYNMNTNQEQLGVPEKIQAKQVTRAGDMEFKRVLQNMEIPGVN